jgi:hypothetical protein
MSGSWNRQWASPLPDPVADDRCQKCRRRSKRCKATPTPNVRTKITSNVSMLMLNGPRPCCKFVTSEQEIRAAMWLR